MRARSARAGAMLALAAAIIAAPFAAVAQPSTSRPAAQLMPGETIDALIAEASRRFAIPVHWIDLVMRAESGRNPRAVSRAGAIGLMQLMPATYAELQRRYGLGADPFALRDNIHAGTAYLRELNDRYGPRGMLAAYNAGPRRWEQHLRAGRPLPRETQAYLARLAPRIAPVAAPVPHIGFGPDLGSNLAAPIFVARDVADAAAGSHSSGGSMHRHAAGERTAGALFVDPSGAAGASAEPHGYRSAPAHERGASPLGSPPAQRVVSRSGEPLPARPCEIEPAAVHSTPKARPPTGCNFALKMSPSTGEGRIKAARCGRSAETERSANPRRCDKVRSQPARCGLAAARGLPRFPPPCPSVP